MKKILLIGGTRFIGRVLMEQLQKYSNYSVSIFSRGKTNEGLFPDIRRIKGDRTTDDVLKIAKEDWDVIVDISCYYPLSLRQLLPALKDKVGRYIFISTGSVFDLDKLKNKVLEESMLQLTFTEEQLNVEGEYVNYGQKKAACETMLMDADWLDKIILRPSIVYGRYDYTDRFYYWLQRIQFQQDVWMPINGIEKVNLVYVDDLATIIRKAIELKHHEIDYNVASYKVMSFKEKLEAVSLALGKTPNFVNISKEFAEANSIVPFSDIPIVTNFDGKNIIQFSTAKLRQHFGDCLSPLEQSLKEMKAYFDENGWHSPTAGMDVIREAELIKVAAKLNNSPS